MCLKDLEHLTRARKDYVCECCKGTIAAGSLYRDLWRIDDCAP